jgi:hypothetical protein
MFRVTIRTHDGKEVFDCEYDPVIEDGNLWLEAKDGAKHTFSSRYWKKVTSVDLDVE